MKKLALLTLSLLAFSGAVQATEQNACLTVRPDFRGVGSGQPTVEKIIALGQLGGNLCPTTPVSAQSTASKQAYRSANVLTANRDYHIKYHIKRMIVNVA